MTSLLTAPTVAAVKVALQACAIKRRWSKTGATLIADDFCECVAEALDAAAHAGKLAPASEAIAAGLFAMTMVPAAASCPEHPATETVRHTNG